MEYVKAGVKQAFIDEYLTVDVSAKVKGIPSEDKLRASLTLDEVKRLADTPCESDVLRGCRLILRIQYL